MQYEHQGELLKEVLELNHKSIKDFAKEAELSMQQVSDFIEGKELLNSIFIEKLEHATKIPSHLWINLQNIYLKEKEKNGVK